MSANIVNFCVLHKSDSLANTDYNDTPDLAVSVLTVFFISNYTDVSLFFRFLGKFGCLSGLFVFSENQLFNALIFCNFLRLRFINYHYDLYNFFL